MSNPLLFSSSSEVIGKDAGLCLITGEFHFVSDANKSAGKSVMSEPQRKGSVLMQVYVLPEMTPKRSDFPYMSCAKTMTDARREVVCFKVLMLPHQKVESNMFMLSIKNSAQDTCKSLSQKSINELDAVILNIMFSHYPTSVSFLLCERCLFTISK